MQSSSAQGTSSAARRLPFSIRVMIVDDHTVLRDTLKLLLATHPEVEVVGEAADGRQAIDIAEQIKPDVILMDTAMPGLNGIEATETIHKRLPRTKVLMLSGYGYEDRVSAALRAGAVGYVLKSATADELLQAIVQVFRSNTYISESIANSPQVRNTLAGNSVESTEPALSPREREVLQLVAEGYGNRGIAERLFISIKTVEAHKEHIVQKLGVRGNAELIRYAIRKGLVTIETDADLGISSKTG
jgi:DNA-binding NarL/FixJ family response regulator